MARRPADPTAEPEPDRREGAPHPREAAALFGQERAEAAFLDAWAGGRLPHGWLLAGPPGVGKATLAYRIARAVIAHGDAAPGSLAVPEGCPVAARIRSGGEPALRVLRRSVDPEKVRPDPATGLPDFSKAKLRTRIVVDDVRRLRQFLHLSVPGGGWRAVIVDPADEMNASAANALLKMLEEPPDRVLMLLLTHAPGGLLPTIRSRCRRLVLPPLDAQALAQALAQAGQPVEPAQAAALAELSDGSAGAALGLIAGGGIELYAAMVAMLAGSAVERGALMRLVARMAPQEARETLLPLAVDLARLLASRLARAAVLGPPAVEAAPGEAALMARHAGHPARARAWAEAAARIAEHGARARAVNLDPAQTILDMFLDLDPLLATA